MPSPIQRHTIGQHIGIVQGVRVIDAIDMRDSNKSEKNELINVDGVGARMCVPCMK